MCSGAGRERLADFIDWVGAQASGKDVRLLIAGDIVDFLAERDADGGFSSFNQDEEVALGKLNRILRSTQIVWDALAKLCKAGVGLTFLLGNHDIELSFPALRARLGDVLGGGFDFLYDNEAFRAGPLLVEHGNRYDGFNSVDHDALRRIRSHLSRGETPKEAFPPQPGSDLVSKVMNRIKEKYAFVDLLKPETSGVVPILATLDSRIWMKMGAVIEQAAKAWYRDGRDRDGIPLRREQIAYKDASAGADPRAAAPFPEADVFALANELAERGPNEAGEQIGWFDDMKIDLLLRAFRKRREKDAITFAIGTEAEHYLAPAKAAMRRNLQLFVCGHTHLAKRVKLEGGTYLNTGTWADLMCLPDAVYEGTTEDGRAALATFLKNIKDNRIDRYRRQVPTFARIDIDGASAKGDVFFYDGNGSISPISDAGMLKRLGIEA
jgi:UDP-2,3-diacylglucosamine pyrophosphatase LpxH